MEATVYNQEGKVQGKVMLPEFLFNQPLNNDLLYQVVLSYRANQRKPLAFTKDRSEVRGGGKKPWRQKGTGRARHSSIRSPLWKGGGLTFGPRQKEYHWKKKINQKMKKAALRIILSQKLRDKEIKIIDKIDLKKPKTKEMDAILHKIFPDHKKKSIILLLENGQADIKRSAKNIPYLSCLPVKDINPLSLLNSKYLLLPVKSLSVLEKILS